MLDALMSGLKDQATSALTAETGLDASQAQAALPLAQESIKEGLMGAATGGNLGGITDLLKAAGGGGGVAGLAQNAVYGSIATKFLGKLTSSLGLGEGIAQKVSSVALPMILGKLGSQATKDGGGSLDLGAIASMVGGGAAGGAGDLLGKAGGMLGGLMGK